MSQNKGLILVLITALVSGMSIFINKFGVSEMNPFVFATMKNLVVGVFLISLIFLLKEWRKLVAMSKAQWIKLMAIGLIGGSIPFLLYFYALNMTSAINAGFIHKSMFLFIGLFAFVLLKEKMGKNFLIGACLLFAGNLILFSDISEFGFAEILIFIAILFWAGENVLSKHVLTELKATQVAFGRMFFGSLFMIGFLIVTNQFNLIFELGTMQIQWVLLTSALLFLYVISWYSGLKYIDVSKAAVILLLGQPITALLSFAFLGTGITIIQAAGFLLLLVGVLLVLGISQFISLIKMPVKLLAREK
ncbi:MAG: DMT family transporter [Candidatus Diapherotrites archaeon]